MSRKYGVSLAEDVKLDRYALDAEAEVMPSLLYEWGVKLADAKAECDAAENRMKFISAQAFLRIKEERASEKPTVDMLKAYVEVDNAVVEAKQEYLDAQEKVYSYNAAVEALRDKSSQIKNLTQQWCAGYYGSRVE